MSILEISKRFASHTEYEILDKRSKCVPSTTEKANKRAANLLQEYLRENNNDEQFELFNQEKLNDVLKQMEICIK